MNLRLRLCIGVLSMLAPLLSAAAGGAHGPAPRRAEAGGFHYLVLETRGARPDAELPMLIGLHYSGAAPEDMLDHVRQLGIPMRIVLPQGPIRRRAGWTWFSGDTASRAAVVDAMVARLAGFVSAVRAGHATRGRPIVMGVSYGGDLALLLALRHPDEVAAAFPVAARALPEWMPSARTCASSCPRIRALHGTADAVVPMAPTASAVQQLAAMGFDATLTPYPGVAHDFDAAMQRDVRRQIEALVRD